jgi:hypothetical protein
MDKYRIYRTDPKNIAIQKWSGTEWRSISYHGNSVNSLVSGLFELIMSQHTPEHENIPAALVGVRLELVYGIEKIEKMIEEWCGNKD